MHSLGKRAEVNNLSGVRDAPFSPEIPKRSRAFRYSGGPHAFLRRRSCISRHVLWYRARADYAGAGFRVCPCRDPRGRYAGRTECSKCAMLWATPCSSSPSRASRSRRFGHGGAIYVDVLAKNNVAYSVTVVRRFAKSSYIDAAGITFGSSGADVRAKLGEPKRTSTNSDDGSVDFWYVDESGAKIYEFYHDNLGFIQILPSPKLQSAFASPDAVLPGDGTSVATAIRIRPSNLIGNSMWIDAYLAMNQCGSKGHWKETSLKMAPDDATKDPLAYTTVHAQCTDGGTERDFVFDTHGMVTKTGPNGPRIRSTSMRRNCRRGPGIFCIPGAFSVPDTPVAVSPNPGLPRVRARNRSSRALALRASRRR